jgi:hypothetical protein
MNREVHVRFCEGARLKCLALLAYLKGYADGREARAGIESWVRFYNHERLHQALGNRTPMAVWRAGVLGESEIGQVPVDFLPIVKEKMRAGRYPRRGVNGGVNFLS